MCHCMMEVLGPAARRDKQLMGRYMAELRWTPPKAQKVVTPRAPKGSRRKVKR